MRMHLTALYLIIMVRYRSVHYNFVRGPSDGTPYCKREDLVSCKSSFKLSVNDEFLSIMIYKICVISHSLITCCSLVCFFQAAADPYRFSYQSTRICVSSSTIASFVDDGTCLCLPARIKPSQTSAPVAQKLLVNISIERNSSCSKKFSSSDHCCNRAIYEALNSSCQCSACPQHHAESRPVCRSDSYTSRSLHPC